MTVGNGDSTGENNDLVACTAQRNVLDR